MASERLDSAECLIHSPHYSVVLPTQRLLFPCNTHAALYVYFPDMRRNHVDVLYGFGSTVYVRRERKALKTVLAASQQHVVSGTERQTEHLAVCREALHHYKVHV